MVVKRITANLSAPDPATARAFYGDLLGLDIKMDFGWIITFGSDSPAQPQVSIASEGGSGTEVPDLSIEVDDIETVYSRAKSMGIEITYDLIDEPWGVTRFYVRDPFGNLINILAHQ